VLKIALEARAMKIGRVALDGTKVKANARMKEKEKDLRAQAEAADAEEHERHGRDQRGDQLP
jgi:hypothetical protein